MILLKNISFWLGWFFMVLPILMVISGFLLTYLLGCDGLNEGGGGHCAVGGESAKIFILSLLLLGTFGIGIFIAIGAAFFALSWVLSYWA